MKKLFTSLLLCVFLINIFALPADAKGKSSGGRSSGGSKSSFSTNKASNSGGSSYKPSSGTTNNTTVKQPTNNTSNDSITSKPSANDTNKTVTNTNSGTTTKTDVNSTSSQTKAPGSTGYNKQKIQDSMKTDSNGNKTYTSSTGKQYNYKAGQPLRFTPGMNMGDWLFMYMIFSSFDNDNDRMEESEDQYTLYYTDPMTSDEYQYGVNYKLGEALCQALESDKVCINCELPVADEDSFCPKCGKLAFDQRLTSVLACSNCNMVYRGFEQCPNDDTALIPVSQVATAPTNTEVSEEQESGPNLFVLIFGGLVVLILGGATFSYMKQGKR